MSCCGPTRPINPRRLGEPGQWVMPPRPASRSSGCVHTWEYRNILGVVGGPVVTACTGCGESHYPTWVPDVLVRSALPASASLVGDAEWVDVLRERGAA